MESEESKTRFTEKVSGMNIEPKGPNADGTTDDPWIDDLKLSLKEL